jgi:hypothetical protein
MNFLSGMSGLGFILVSESENDIHIFLTPGFISDALVSSGSYATTHVCCEASCLEVVKSALSCTTSGMNALYNTILASHGWRCCILQYQLQTWPL